MPRKPRIPKFRAGELTVDQEFELIDGPGAQPSEWPTEQARRAAWEAHRERFEPGGDLAVNPLCRP
jgi:hypothetical protein